MIIRKKVTNEAQTGYCHNKKCELYPNGYQGACGLEGEYFKCICCGKLVHTEAPKE